jgi:hypothetical protein
MMQRVAVIVGTTMTMLLAGTAGCGTASSGNTVAPSSPITAQTVAATIYGTNSTGVGELSILTTGAITSTSTIAVPGLTNSGEVLQGIAVGALGEIFVGEQLTFGSSPTGAVLVFAPGATPTSAPIRTISGPSTLLTAPNSLAVDAYGDVYVGQLLGDLIEFGPGANGNAVPIRMLKGIGGKNTGIAVVLGMGVDTSGNLYIANDLGGSIANGPDTNNILIFSPTQSGDVSPSRAIAGSATLMEGNTLGVSVDASNNLYVVTESVTPSFNAILEFAAGASGNVAPIREITGSNTTLTGSVSTPVLDSTGNIYVIVGHGGLPNLTRFSPGANGNVIPTAISSIGTTIGSYEIALH